MMNRLTKFFSELKRRRVLRVVVIYVTVVWVVLQLGDILFEAYGIDSSVMQLLVTVSLAAFPAVAIIAWFVDWKKSGLEVTDVQDVKRLYEIQDDPSIAVLPFTDISPEGNYEYFGHGLAEEITVRLTNFEWLRVAARTSAFGMKSLEQDIKIIGEKLSVSTILDGTLQVFGDKIRVSVQLVDVQRGLTLWAQRYDGDMSDVFQIQDSMAKSVVATLGERLNVNHVPESPASSSEEPAQDAYNLYLTARYHYNKAIPIERDKAAKLYTEAIKISPNYAPAYAGLAISRAVTLIGGSELLSPLETMPPARDAALKAIELDPESAEAKGALAWITLVFDWEFRQSLNLFEEAIVRGRNANTLVGYAICLNCAGKLDDAIMAIETAVEIEPLSMVALSSAARFYRYANRIVEARSACESLLSLDSKSKAAAINLFEISMSLNDFEGAEKAIAMEIEFAGKGDLGLTFHEGRLAGGRGDIKGALQARDRVESFVSSRYVPSFMPAMLSLIARDYEEMFRWLYKGLAERDSFLIDLPMFTMPKAIREDPRYDEINERVGVYKFRQLLAQEKRDLA
jgi:TolB-like protein/tetratricopeptide (TPR) repeat protein